MAANLIYLVYVQLENLFADLFTKTLVRPRPFGLLSKLGMIDIDALT